MKGRPVLGLLSGLFLGVFVAILLQQYGIRPLDNLSVFGLPGAGAILGLIVARVAPFGSKG